MAWTNPRPSLGAAHYVGEGAVIEFVVTYKNGTRDIVVARNAAEAMLRAKGPVQRVERVKS